ncbi:hypothetical protein AYK20_00250 [Thermoplasmatales archaeon SG8-52-1]|nr:MAG: hypothetical protein AYK20_00250 [Thermoplasmatales archaeon SG8-52-1]
MIIKKVLFNKTLVIVILVLFIGTSYIPSIAGNNYDNQDTSQLTFYTFDKTGTKKYNAELSNEIVEEIFNTFEKLRYKITNTQDNDGTNELKNNFIELLDSNGLIPQHISKEYVKSLLNPKWLGKRVGSRVRNSIIPTPFTDSGSAFFCSIAGEGAGLLFSPIILPRPRIATIWSVYIDAYISAANLLTGHGFISEGPQLGAALGFMGIGLSLAVPGFPSVFAFGGYALAAYVQGDDVESYPLNQLPIISEENPQSGSGDVSVSLSELSFHISDPDGDKMSYTVTTEPDIGSGHGNGFDGVYKVPVSGLEYDKSYSWTVSVSDGEDTVEKKFSFITKSSPPFDPFEKGWNYRKKITINHSQISNDLINFPVLISIVDSDLADKAQSDGNDILFMDSTGVANKLYHEIEKYNGVYGELISWINVTKIFSDVDTTFYIYYGNSQCSSQQIPYKTWDSHYKAVYHMNQDSGGLIDSSSNNIDCNTVIGTPDFYKKGKVGYAIDFEKTEEDAFEGIDIFDGQEELSIEAWINLEDYNPSHCMIASHEDAWYFYISYQYKSVIFGCHGGVSGSCAIDDIECPLNTWYCVAGSWSDPYDRMRVYGNGILKDTYIETLPMYSSSYNFAVGYQDNMGKFFDGIIDEIRISDIERSEEWISTSYKCQNNPSSFSIIGQEESKN